MKRLPAILIAILAASLTAAGWDISEKYTGPKYFETDTAWHPDILRGYEARYVNQGKSFDGPCRSTIIRKLAPGGSRRAYVYIHGFNDYFFQSEMGQRFVDSGFNFYAVDLRRYGRSKLPWQYPYDIRRQQEYFDDIDSALMQARHDGNTDITLSGHSTGGLTVALLAAIRGDTCGADRIVTDSPFLEWNFSPFMRDIAIPVVAFFGQLNKNGRIPQGHCDGYAYSLLKEYHGEWTYNTDWKMVYSPPVTCGWIRSINSAQSNLMKHASRITVPVLVMHSSRKIDGCAWTPEFQTGDCVLDPEMIRRRGLRLGASPEVCAIDSGLHDLILSRRHVRDAAYDTIFSFIRRHPPTIK